MSYVVLDLETDGRETFKRFCNPLDKNHKIALVGYKRHDDPEVTIDIRTDISPFDGTKIYYHGMPGYEGFWPCPATYTDTRRDTFGRSKIKYLIGQNIKFDLLWFWGYDCFQQWLVGKNSLSCGKIWDTLLVEYLLHAQQPIDKDLDTLSLKYGGSIKDSYISDQLKEGKLFSEIEDQERAADYCKSDVLNTELVANAQRKRVQALGMMPLVDVYMRHLLAVTEMEYNGLYIDQEVLEKNKQLTIKKRDELFQKIQQLVAGTDWPKHIEFNPGSLDHVSYVMFGGIITRSESQPVQNSDGTSALFKSGRPRTKKQPKQYYIQGFRVSTRSVPLNKKGLYKTDDEVLSQFDIPLAKLLLEYRAICKLLNTYYEGFAACIMPDSCVHSEFKMAKTITGRLSSSNPNVQNIPAHKYAEVLQMFTSRFEDGVILEFDYHQLEIVLQAFVTGCEQMRKDIANNIDFHCLRLSYAEDLPYETVYNLCNQESPDPIWKEKRFQAKTISFQKSYGAHPEKLAAETGLRVETVEKIFEAEDKMYPEIPQFYSDVVDHLRRNIIPGTTLLLMKNKQTGVHQTKPGEFVHTSVYTSCTGKRYQFEEKGVIGKKGVFRYWHMPTIQNYPIQGLAADLMAMMVGNVFLALQPHRDKALLVNEVHDAIYVDCKRYHLDFIQNLVYTELMKVKDEFKKQFNLDFNVPLGVDVKVGKNWYECKQGD